MTVTRNQANMAKIIQIADKQINYHNVGRKVKWELRNIGNAIKCWARYTFLNKWLTIKITELMTADIA